MIANLAAPKRKHVVKSAVATEPHIIIRARAGTGKTTTIIEGLNELMGVPSKFTPSAQQKAIWDCLKLSSGKVQSICLVAFNKAIATVLQERVPRGVDAMTMHSMGFKSLREAFGYRIRVNEYRSSDILSSVCCRGIRELRADEPTVVKAVLKLVELCKSNLVDGTDPDRLRELADYYDVNLTEDDDSKGKAKKSKKATSRKPDAEDDPEDCSERIFKLVPLVLERAKDVFADGCIDFNDMVWLPVVLHLPMTKYDLLLADEVQDLSRVQQEMTKRVGKRLVYCGDDRQSLYGFIGADCDSMDRIHDELGLSDRGCEIFPLTVTRRCGKAIVRTAQKIVPDFEAFEGNGEGSVRFANYPIQDGRELEWSRHFGSQAEDGDMVLCRTNAPLVGNCFRFLKRGIKATIQGRDIGQNLISTVTKLKSVSIGQVLAKLELWLASETKKENAKAHPSDTKIASLQDRKDCIEVFCADLDAADSVQALIAVIENVFTDDRGVMGIKLSTIHKAKGQESRRVFLLEPKGAECPLPFLQPGTWQYDQDVNARYVAITRAIEELVFVR